MNEAVSDAPPQVSMPATRHLAWSTVPVSRGGLGLSRIGSVNSPISASEAKRLVQAAFDRGINYYDTADVYGQGDSERLLGSALRSHRERIVICTKAGYLVSARARLASYAKPLLSPILRLARRSPRAEAAARNLATGSAMAQDFSSEHIRNSLDASLRRLKTDYVDLFMLHSPPTNGLDLERIAATLQAAKQAGKIRAIGVSSRSLADVAVWKEWPSVDVIQVGLDSDIVAARQLLAGTNERRISVVAREVISRGGSLAERSPAAALRSALQVADIVLFGTTSLNHLRDNVAALSGV